MIRVLIVDDSAVVRELIAHIVGADPALEVIGKVTNGAEGVRANMELRPDVITMDIHMPELDGFEATRQIMESVPVPIVIVSGSLDVRETSAAFRALEAGALAAVARPPGPGHPGHDEAARILVRTLKSMSEVKVVRRWPKDRFGKIETKLPAIVPFGRRRIAMVAVGASTGGPAAVQAFISALPKPFPAPVLVVQHMSPGFIQGYADWLAQQVGCPVMLGAHGAQTLPGHVYLAPDGRHMGVDRSGRMILSEGAAEYGLCPSVANLFRSTAESYGANAAAVLLTGMGRDGAEELKRLKDAGAVTFAQDEESAVIHGMPGEAIRLGAAMYILSPERIAQVLASLTIAHCEGPKNVVPD